MITCWRIQMLGGLRVECGERVIDRFRSQNIGALLAYLAYHCEQPHSREMLVDLLWPNDEPETGRQNVRTALAWLRRYLESEDTAAGSVVLADRLMVQLNPDAVTTDTAQFMKAVTLANRADNDAERLEYLRKAVGLYQGELLPGYYQEWVVKEQRRLADLFFMACRRLTALHREAGNLEEAIDCARRSVAVDPLREEAHQDLMRVLVVAGQPAAALHQYEDLKRILKRELDEEPSNATRKLAEEIQRRMIEGEPIDLDAPPAVLTVLVARVDRPSDPSSDERDLSSAPAAWHRDLFRDLRAEFPEAQPVVARDDALAVSFAKPSDAVRFALLVQSSLQNGSEQDGRDVPLNIGIHLGEIGAEETPEAKESAGPLAALLEVGFRLTELASGGQILMTAGVFDSARPSLRNEDLPGVGDLSWLSHGPYLLAGFEEPHIVCEVGERGKAPLRMPPDGEAGKSIALAAADLVLGWRPAVGQSVPGTEWGLLEKLGVGGFGEVWRARHHVTNETRVFKFCFRADRLRALKREMTLFRLLREVLGERPDIARLHGVQFEEAPYYLELEDTPGGNLAEWIEARGGFEGRGPRDEGRGVPLQLRLEIVAQIATALAAAHSVGVIHKDVKPSNVLVEEVGRVANPSRSREVQPVPKPSNQLCPSDVPIEERGRVSDPSYIQVRLTDFGIGQLTDRAVLERAGVTATGFTETVSAELESSSRSGTRLYMAPELLTGGQPTIQSDIYSLGVLLYQMIIGDLSKPITTDWERRIEDPLLREDLHRCLAGESDERLAGATELAHRLRTLEGRRAVIAEREEAERVAQAEREAAERAHIRRRRLAMVLASVAGLFILLAIALGYGLRREQIQRALVEAEKERTEHELYINTIANADKCIDELRYDRARQLLAACPRKYRKWEWGRLQYRCNLDLMTLKGHEWWVYSVAFSPDGKYVATGSFDRTARLWDVETGDPITSFTGHSDGVTGVAFSPDGKYLATVSADTTARLWDVKTGREIRPFTGHTNFVIDVAFSPDGRLLATAGCDNTARIWDVETGKQRSLLVGHTAWVKFVAFSPDGKRLVTASNDKKPKLWDVKTGLLIRTYDKGQATRGDYADFSPDGKCIATCPGQVQNPTIVLWDVETTDTIMSFTGHLGYIYDTAFSPDGKYLAAAGMDKIVRLWDVESGDEIRTFKGHSGRIYSVVFSPDGKRLATASADGTAKIWDVDTQPDFRVLKGHTNYVWSVAFHPEGNRLATGGIDGMVRLWDVETGRGLRTINPGLDRVNSVAFSPDGKHLAVGFKGGQIGLWDSKAERRSLIRTAHVFGYSSIAFGLEGTRLATASGYRLPWWRAEGEEVAKVWNTKTREQVTTLIGHLEAVNCVAFRPPHGGDDGLWATGSWDETVILWDAPSGEKKRTLGGMGSAVHCVAFSPDGRLLAAGTDRSKVVVWDLDTDSSSTLKVGDGTVFSVTFSPDGKRLAVATTSHAAGLWDIETEREVLTLRGHENEVLSVAFSPDGRHLATASGDETAILWPTFPWNEDDYPGDADMPLEDRIELYKRQYWKKYFAALEPGVSSAKRIVDASTFSPGVPVDVKLELVWDGDKSSVTVVENVPAGWMIHGVSRGKVQGNKIAWEIEPWTSPGATLEYTATPPATASDLPAVFANAFFRVDSGYPSPIEDTSIPPLMPPGVWILQQGSSPGPEYDGCKDAHILLHKKFRNNNAGGCEALGEGDWTGGAVEHVKILIQFDLSSVPSTFTLGRSELRLYAYGEYKLGRRNEHTIYAARVLKSWGEGEVQDPEGIKDGKNIPPQKGDVTANSAQHGQLSWDIPGALGVNDVADAESSATVGVNWPEWVSLDVTDSVRYFLENPDKNYGWKISQDDKRGVDDSTIEYVAGTYMYKSSEAPEVHLRPMLILVPSETTDDER